jgi:hypothetical protein
VSIGALKPREGENDAAGRQRSGEHFCPTVAIALRSI